MSALRLPALAPGLLGGTLFAVLLLAPAVGAQTGSPLACADPRTAGLGTDRTGPPVDPEIGSSIDTTYTTSVDQRRWTWRNHSAGMSAGVRGTAPASWHACAGIWTHAVRATVVVENAWGQVHVRASLEPLLEVLRRHQAVPGENPRRENR